SHTPPLTSFPTRRSSDLGSKTPPSTGLTSATVAFVMPGPSTYEFRLWQNCGTFLAKSQIVTVQSGGAFSFTVNGVTTPITVGSRSEEHTSELQSRVDLVC